MGARGGTGQLGCKQMLRRCLFLRFGVSLLMLLVLSSGCSNFLEPREIDPFKNATSDENGGWVVVMATIDNVYQIYLLDYNEPSIYRNISATLDGIHSEPTLFPDQSKVIFHWDDPPFFSSWAVYDVAEDTTSILVANEGYLLGDVHRNVVFDQDMSGIYYGECFPAGAYRLVYYSFLDSTVSYLTKSDYVSYPIGWYNNQTLIVYSNDVQSSGGSAGFYFFDVEEGFVKKIENPYLKEIKTFTWNPILGLAAIVDWDGTKTDTPAQKRYIAVTNLDGSYYHQFTNGLYDDQLPTWGPGGGVLLFRRQDVDDFYSLPTRVMKVDLRTGIVEQFVENSAIDGATFLSWPHHQY